MSQSNHKISNYPSGKKKKSVSYNTGNSYCSPKSSKTQCSCQLAQPYSVGIDFSDVSGMENLTGSIMVDPNERGAYTICVDGELSECFANLTSVRAVNDGTILLDTKAELLANGHKEIYIEAGVPIRVNGTLVDKPVTGIGYNFRMPDSTELKPGLAPVVPIAGFGSTGGDIMFGVDLTSLAGTGGLFGLVATNYDGVTQPVTLESSTINLISASSAVDIQADDINDGITVDVRVNPAQCNRLTITENGLTSCPTFNQYNSGSQTNISFLDTDPTSQQYPVGSFAVWDNTSLDCPALVRKTTDVGVNQWEVIGACSDSGLSGDVTGSINGNVVERVQNIPFLAGTAQNGDVFRFNNISGQMELNSLTDSTSSVSIQDSNTVDLILTSTIAGSNTNYDIQAISKLQVNGSQVANSATDVINFRTATTGEIISGFSAVTPFLDGNGGVYLLAPNAGTGTTGLTQYTVIDNGVSTNVDVVDGSRLTISANNNGISLSASDASDQILAGIKLSPRAGNVLQINNTAGEEGLYVSAPSVLNETVTSLGLTGTDLIYIDENAASNTISLAGIINNDTFIQGGTNVIVTGSGQSTDPFVISSTTFNETLTSISYDGSSNELVYTDENTTVNRVTLGAVGTGGSTSSFTNTITGHQIGSHNNGNGSIVTVNETVTVLNLVGNQLQFTDENGNRTDLNLPTGGTGGDGNSISSITNNIGGNRIATHNDGNNNTTDIDETITSLSISGNTLTYSKEGGAQDVINLPTSGGGTSSTAYINPQINNNTAGTVNIPVASQTNLWKFYAGGSTNNPATLTGDLIVNLPTPGVVGEHMTLSFIDVEVPNGNFITVNSNNVSLVSVPDRTDMEFAVFGDNAWHQIK